MGNEGVLPEDILFARPDLTPADEQAVLRVLRSGWLTTGDECIRLEQELAERLCAPHVIATSSCTSAMQIALAYLDLPRGARVGVPVWTFPATALVVHHAGLRPVLLDIDPATLNLSADAFEAEASQLHAVMPVHFGGVPVDVGVRHMAAELGLPVIEDAAHALGAADDRGPVNGRSVVAAAFSFYATKNLTSAEGGALATHDRGLAEFARSYRQHGMSREAWKRYRSDGKPLYDIVAPGIKANLPDLLAALARSQLRRFDTMQRARRELVLAYRERLQSRSELQVLPPVLAEDGADHLFVVALHASIDRGEVIRRLQGDRIGSSVHFTPLTQLSWLRENAEVGRGGCSNSENMAPRVLSLPLHPGLTIDHVDRVCDSLVRAVRGCSLST